MSREPCVSESALFGFRPFSNEWDDVAVGWDDGEAVRSYTAAALTSLLAVLAGADKSLDGAKVVRLRVREPEWYDLIVFWSVCSFLDDYPAKHADLAILLVPGGLFIQWDWERDDSDVDPTVSAEPRSRKPSALPASPQRRLTPYSSWRWGR